MSYTIGEFSKKSGLSIDTLRYYEKLGIISSQRDINNRRIYTDEDFTWVQFVTRLRKTGMGINKMQEYAKLRYQGDETVDQRLVMLFDQLESLHQQESDIQSHIKFIERKIKYYIGSDGSEQFDSDEN